MPVPKSFNPSANLQAVLRKRYFSFDGTGITHDLWFRDKVRTGGDWDYKKDNPRMEPFGNYHYGYMGERFGYSGATLLRMAGRAQQNDNPELGDGGTVPSFAMAFLGLGGQPPYGDQVRDQTHIAQGVNAAERGLNLIKMPCL